MVGLEAAPPLLEHRDGATVSSDPGEPWPPGDAEYFANLNGCEEAESHYLEDAFDEDPPDDLDSFTRQTDPDDPVLTPAPSPIPTKKTPMMTIAQIMTRHHDGEAPPTSTVIPEKSETNPLPDTPPDEEPHRDDSNRHSCGGLSAMRRGGNPSP